MTAPVAPIASGDPSASSAQSAQSAPRVVLVATSPRVAPGLLSAAAWAVLGAGPVLTAGPTSVHSAPLAAAGIPLELVDTTALGASGIADLIVERGARTGCVTWLSATDGEGGLAAALATLARGDAVRLEVLAGAWDLPGARLLDAVAVMDRLRSPGGCPWDAEQTHASLAPYLIEETYEAYEALEDGQYGAPLREELGDVLLQVLFHARLAQEATAEPWSIDDLADGLVTKLIGRHPHVFAPTTGLPIDAAGVEANWEAIKTAEKQRTSVVDGVALGQPALSLAAKLLGRAGKAGLPTSLAGLPGLGDPGPHTAPDELLGRALFGLVAQARTSGTDPEAALRVVARAYARALRSYELEQAASRATATDG